MMKRPDRVSLAKAGGALLMVWQLAGGCKISELGSDGVLNRCDAPTHDFADAQGGLAVDKLFDCRENLLRLAPARPHSSVWTSKAVKALDIRYKKHIICML